MKTNLPTLLAVALAVVLAQLPGYAQTGDKAPSPNDKQDIEIRSTPIDQALRGLAEMAGINIDIDPKVTDAGKAPDGTANPAKSITVSYQGILPINALLGTLENHDLHIVTNQTTGIYRVTIKDPKALPPLVTEVFQLKYGTTNIVPVVQSTLTDTRAKVLAIERNSQLVIVSTEPEMAVVRRLVQDLDVAPKQVLIEAKILETSMNPRSVRGIDWAGTFEAQNFGWGNGNTTGTGTTSIPGTSTSTTTTLPGGRTVTQTTAAPATETLSLIHTLGVAGITANTFNGWNPALGILNADGVRGVLSFLNSHSETEVIATPSAVTLDNVQAKLEVVRAFPVFTQNPGSAQTPATTTLSYTNVGTILTVTPRVTANSNIALRVSPEVSNIDGQNSQIINGENNLANVYASRRIDTQVMIPSGNTLVMGGLVSDTSTKSHSKVPLLGDTPGFGLLFRRDTKNRSKQNLLIFVTPTIVQDFDFQYQPSTFLRNSPGGDPKPEEGPWDSGKPARWGGKKQ
jgi:type II secretory pathway component GspD/PulD (secretin)